MTINYETSTIEDVVQKLCQIEIRKDTQPSYSEGLAFSVRNRTHIFRPMGQGHGTCSIFRGTHFPGRCQSHQDRCYKCGKQGHWAKKTASRKGDLIEIDHIWKLTWKNLIIQEVEPLVQPPPWKECFSLVKTAYGTKVQGVMTNNGMEFVNSNMVAYLKSKGIQLFNSVPYTPQQNGIAERAIWIITEEACAMLYAT